MPERLREQPWRLIAIPEAAQANNWQVDRFASGLAVFVPDHTQPNAEVNDE
jgi:hypothetical protein